MAVPNPEKELDRLRKLVAKQLPPLLVLCGASAWFRNAALELAIAAVPDRAELVRIDGQDVEVRGLAAAGDEPEPDDDAGDGEPARGYCSDLDLLTSKGLFSATAFVVVRRGDRWLRRHGAALLAALPRLAPGCGLILEVTRLDRRTRLAKELAARGALVEFRDLYETPYDRARGPLEGELVQWVVGQGRRIGVPLTPEAALLVAAQTGKEPGELLAELGRLAAQLPAAPQRQPLRPDDLRGRLSLGMQSTPFELADALLAHERSRAFAALRAMFDRGVKGKDGAMQDSGVFPFTISWLFQSLGQVLEGRLLLDAGVALGDVPARAGVRGFVDRYLEQVRGNDADRLERGILWLLYCQRQKRLTGEDDDLLLERFLVGWFAGAPAPLFAEQEA